MSFPRKRLLGGTRRKNASTPSSFNYDPTELAGAGTSVAAELQSSRSWDVALPESPPPRFPRAQMRRRRSSGGEEYGFWRSSSLELRMFTALRVAITLGPTSDGAWLLLPPHSVAVKITAAWVPSYPDWHLSSRPSRLLETQSELPSARLTNKHADFMIKLPAEAAVPELLASSSEDGVPAQESCRL